LAAVTVGSLFTSLNVAIRSSASISLQLSLRTPIGRPLNTASLGA